MFSTQPLHGVAVDSPSLRLAYPGYLFLFAAIALLLGGSTGQGFLSDTIVQLISLPLLCLALWRVKSLDLDGLRLWAFLFPLLLVGLAALQLVPLPPSVWMSLPGREAAVSAFEAAGLAPPWLPISLDPGATWRSALSLIPAFTAFFALPYLGAGARSALTLLIIAVAVASVFLGLAQLSQGPDSALRFYDITVPTVMVGFFANPNHAAALLYVCIPLGVAWCIRLASERSPEGLVALLGMIFVLFLLVLGIAMTRSLAGLAIGALAFLGSGALLLRRVSSRLNKYTLGLIAIAVLALVGFGARVIVPRMISDTGSGISEQIRVGIYGQTVDAIVEYAPLGSGFGTFVPVYAMAETESTFRNTFINRAHSDWLEWTLEGGVFALGLMSLFLILYCGALVRIWGRGDEAHVGDPDLERAWSLAIGLLLIHSIVDYPLRTTAMMVVFAVGCALMFARVTPEETEREEAQGKARDFVRPLEFRRDQS